MNRILLVVGFLVSALLAIAVVLLVFFVVPPFLEVPVGNPSAPQALQAVPSDGEVSLSWSPPLDDGGSPITTYRIYRGTVSGNPSLLVEVGNVLTYSDLGLTNGVTYYYQVSAVNAIAEGARSTEASATPARFLALETVHAGLNTPVAFAFAPDGRIFYNELQAGRIRIIQDGSVLPTPFVSLNVVGRNEMGLMGLALDPDFTTEPLVYAFYTYEDVDGTFNRISRFPAVGNVAGAEEVLLDRLPANAIHNSGRVGFGPDGFLYASLGDTGDQEQSQDPQTLPGKILRMRRDGFLPANNPFAGSYTYLYGIRNVFGFDFSPAGFLFFTENGPSGNDEVNLGLRGENYGWPEVQGDDPDPRFIRPLVVFSPAIAPTGLGFYTGDRLGPGYEQMAYFGSWNFGRLYRLVGDAEADEGFRAELVLDPELGGILDVVNGPDGYLYISFPDRIARVILEPDASMAPSPDPCMSRFGNRGSPSDMTLLRSPRPLTRLKSEVRLTESAREGGPVA